MRRPPNMALSTWFRQNAIWDAIWVLRGSCGQRQDLPWTADYRPSPDDFAEMSAVCVECPVRPRCANYAVNANGGRGIDGGYYAGFWLPWPSSTESGDTKLLRSRARRSLKTLIRPLEVLDAALPRL